jgi:hypothetical protein
MEEARWNLFRKEHRRVRILISHFSRRFTVMTNFAKVIPMKYVYSTKLGRNPPEGDRVSALGSLLVFRVMSTRFLTLLPLQIMVILEPVPRR